jgi:hypothetical protein
MANTTNYNWETPDDTDLVKDGAAAIRTLGSSIDTTTKALNPETTLGDIAYRSATSNTNTRLAIGSAGQVLTVAAGVPSWATPTDQTPLTTKGDVFTFSTVDARLGVGANGTVLTADSAETTGLKWAAPAASSGPTFAAYSNTQRTLTTVTWTKVGIEVEDWDTDSCYDNSVNYRFTPNKSGYYQINYGCVVEANGTLNQAALYKNGSVYHFGFRETTLNVWGSNCTLVYANGTTDYFEIYAYGGTGAATTNYGTDRKVFFQSIWIRS